jgi:hypothetical protein
MNAQKTLPRPWALAGLLLVLAISCRAEDAPAKPDSNLDIIRYKTPAKWNVSDRAGETVRTLVAPESDASELALIVIMLTPAKEDLDLRATFDATLKQLTSNRKVLESGEATSARTRQGLDALSQTLVTQGEGNQRLYARMVGAKVHDRMAGIYYLATSQRMYDLHQTEMDDLLRSASFTLPEAGATAAATDEQLLKEAKERFAKDAASRRKPHTISGNIIGTDGKPIPNADAYRVFVWGTTIAAEKTNYGLDVDAKGHFEQQVPDGLYQIKATCIVKLAGSRVPVDLVWLDDKRVGVVQSSDKGIVRDFCLAMSGLRPGEDAKDLRNFFGGAFKVTGPSYNVTQGSYSARHPGAKVKLTLTPQGPLVDGSKRQAYTAEYDITELNYGSERKVPIGVYRVIAVLIDKDGAKHPLQCTRAGANAFAASVDITWECSRDDPETRSDPAIDVKD